MQDWLRVALHLNLYVCACVCAGRAGRSASQSKEKEEEEKESEKVMGYIGIPERVYVTTYTSDLALSTNGHAGDVESQSRNLRFLRIVFFKISKLFKNVWCEENYN